MTSRADHQRRRSTPCSHARRLSQLGPTDLLLATSAAAASLPLVGRHLQRAGSFAAMGVWGMQYADDFVAAARRRVSPSSAHVRQHERNMTKTAALAALQDFVPPSDLATDWPAPDQLPPLLRASAHRRAVYRSSVRYGRLPSQVLDVWRAAHLPNEPAPVVVFVPGGGWIHGSRRMQGYALMAHLASQGWVCLSIDYRVAPHSRWPAHLTDVKTAVAWAREHAHEFGGDQNFVAVAGCSAGAHLAALTGLTANDALMQSELPVDSDTAVDAVVALYGRYDWEDRSTPERLRFMDFLERVVVARTAARYPEVFRQASPIAQVHRGAPPFFVIHGTADWIIPVDQAQSFVERLRAVSDSSVCYLELPGAGHGFDLVDGPRTGSTMTSVALFLNHVRRNSLLVKAV
ncbi:alpha/beta hydrolase fold domain-containing protein [Mycobacterium sp. NPDC051804]|uniref:alpha/beta hydrolase fold domain-containing protein n=1 Tax=Mycobacterium sp. NPDC051804 TaxID=3364295 RepID=UPI00379708C8